MGGRRPSATGASPVDGLAHEGESYPRSRWGPATMERDVSAKRLRIRAARPEERVEMEALASLAFAGVRSVYHPTAAAMSRARFRRPGDRGLVGVSDDRIVATVTYRVEGDVVLAWRLAVHPAHQRRGLARALLEGLAARGRRADCRTIRLHTIRETGNVAIFERMDFRAVDEVVATWCASPRGETLHDVTLERPLPGGAPGARR